MLASSQNEYKKCALRNDTRGGRSIFSLSLVIQLL